MIERQPRCHRHLAPRIAAQILHMLVDAAHKADMRRTAKDALHLGSRAEQRTCVHVDVDEVDDKAVEFASPAVLLDQRTHARRTLLGKILIRIGKDDPVPLRLVERKILCCGKIVDPVEMKDLRPARARNLRRRILRARIDHNHLIGKNAHGAEPTRQILRLILCNDTRRDLHPISSINSLALRCPASLRSASVK